MDYYYILQSIPIFDISDKFVGLKNPPPPPNQIHLGPQYSTLW